MQKGNWTGIDKRVVCLLPKDRRFTELEALISLQIDVHNNSIGTISGYASLWGWSRSKVRRFYYALLSGKDHYVDNRGTRKGQPIRIIFRDLQNETDITKTINGQKRYGTKILNKNKKEKKESL
jgi:hypothetical protein